MAAPRATPRTAAGAEAPAARGLGLRWRVALLAGAAIALLSVAAALTAFWVVRSSLRGDLQRSLQRDVQTVAELYRVGEQGQARPGLSGPTGRVVIQLYDNSGSLLAASTPAFERADRVLPAAVLAGALERPVGWSGELGGVPVEAALAPFDLGVAVVLADDTRFIRDALERLARALALTALALVAVSALVGYLVARAAMGPITYVARRAARLGPRRLEPIPYRGPRDEVGQLAGVLNDLIARLKASMDAQRTFLAETSHELRTPLTSLQGFLERASRRAPVETQRELDDARRIAATMNRLVSDLLQLSRGELVQELTPHLVDPWDDVIQPVAEEFPGVRTAGTAGTLLLGDPERLRQLLRNLVANAVRATGDPARVALGLERDDGRLRLRVCDDGPGIPEEQLPRIFDKFHKGAGGGAGLGLAIARQIAELHGGRIEAQSAPGRTVFTVTLPAVDTGDDGAG